MDGYTGCALYNSRNLSTDHHVTGTPEALAVCTSSAVALLRLPTVSIHENRVWGVGGARMVLWMECLCPLLPVSYVEALLPVRWSPGWGPLGGDQI